LVDNPTIVVVEDTSVVSDADTPTALADVTADGASKDCKVPLVTHACPACVLCKEETSRRESRRNK